MKNKWEPEALFIGALLSSLFLVFILIEPFLNQGLTDKKGQSARVIQMHLNAVQSLNIEKTPSSRTQPNPTEVTNNTAAIETQPSTTSSVPPDLANPPSQPNPSNLANPTQFTFGAVGPKDSSSVPFLGGGGSFHRKASTPPDQKITPDTISEKARQAYQEQVGQEVERRQAQAALIELINSLEIDELYQCEIKAATKKDAASTKCQPSNPKAAFLESISKYLFTESGCSKFIISAKGKEPKSCLRQLK